MPARWCRWEGPQEDTARVVAVGGGLDYAISPRFAVRAFQVDYLHTTLFNDAEQFSVFDRPGLSLGHDQEDAQDARAQSLAGPGMTCKNSGRDLMILNKRTGLLGAMVALAWLAGCGGSGSSSGTIPSAGGNAYVAVPEANAVASYRVSTGSGNLKAVLGSPFSGGTSPDLDCRPSFRQICLYRQPGRKRRFVVHGQQQYRRA